MSTRLAALRQSLRLETALLNARGFNKLWRAEAAERNEIGLCLISISLKRRRLRDDEENEQGDGQQGKH